MLLAQVSHFLVPGEEILVIQAGAHHQAAGIGDVVRHPHRADVVHFDGVFEKIIGGPHTDVIVARRRPKIHMILHAFKGLPHKGLHHLETDLQLEQGNSLGLSAIQSLPRLLEIRNICHQPSLLLQNFFFLDRTVKNVKTA